MKETGIIKRLKENFNINDKSNEDTSEHEFTLGYGDVAFPFSLLVIGLFASILQLGLERARFWYTQCQEKEDDGNTAARESIL